MRVLFIVLFAAVVHYTAAQVPSCSCAAFTEKSRQRRSGAKHVTNYDDFVLKEDTITTAYIYKWERKYKTKTSGIKNTPTNHASQRKHDTPEDSVYILKGFMWFVKQEDNDCDFHIEIGPRNVFGNRIVVEVANENTDLQQKIREALTADGLKIMNCNTSNIKVAHFDVPVPVVVIGLGFYDASHKPNTNHGDIHTKRYSWELHPVKDIVFE